VGTAFAFCEESGLRTDYKDALLTKVRDGQVRVFTDPLASPTSFPFKVAELAGTMSDPAIHQARARVCDLGYLREAYRAADGSVGFRCAAEPVSVYLSKGGVVEDTIGRKCICNALMANIGLGQARGAEVEPGIAVFSRRSLAHGGTEWTAADVSDPAPLRLYRATVSEHFMLDKSGEGPRHDHRTEVRLAPAE